MNFKFEEDILLENEEVLLQPISILAVPDLLKIAIAYPKLLQYSPKPIYTAELLYEYVKQALVERALGTRYTFVIYHKLAQRFIGSTALLNLSNSDDRLEIGATWLDPQFHGTGLNQQCKTLLLTYAFVKLGAKRVELRTDERNVQSQKAIVKIGGIYEGTLKRHTMMIDGFRRNTMLYRLLAEEWFENNNY